jgi:hypothetical protein
VKFPVETLNAALIADSMDVIQSCWCIVSPFPRSWKFLSRRWQWHGSRLAGEVFIRVQIFLERA